MSTVKMPLFSRCLNMKLKGSTRGLFIRGHSGGNSFNGMGFRTLRKNRKACTSRLYRGRVHLIERKDSGVGVGKPSPEMEMDEYSLPKVQGACGRTQDGRQERQVRATYWLFRYTMSRNVNLIPQTLGTTQSMVFRQKGIQLDRRAEGGSVSSSLDDVLLPESWSLCYRWFPCLASVSYSRQDFLHVSSIIVASCYHHENSVLLLNMACRGIPHVTPAFLLSLTDHCSLTCSHALAQLSQLPCPVASA